MNKFKTKKSLGQNFLESSQTIEKIIKLANLTSDSDVIEIGVGSANLTTYLAQSAKRVLGFEIDTSLMPILERKLNDFPNVYITFGDVLKLDLKEEINSKLANFENLTVVANIPYYITSPIIHLLLESGISFKNIILMVQKEVAQRITAKPNTSEYSTLSIYVQEFCDPKLEFIVDKSNFSPAPKVDSAMITLRQHLNQKPLTDVESEMKLVQLAFSNRRKQLKNNLFNLTSDPKKKEQISLLIEELFGNSKIRAQELSLMEYRKLLSKLRENGLW
ncbi:16S rRNA (adenine(1518)-N(6)/adenine(1519)-N(6))-dimethyltransferase RsmA [Xylocopilactobacillus apis]|uniref:Ribosomal RNA small subunit methyltransferase A n=1 Tax=Xylocopilactobacillus apis TaxID=2932183 RepID=A0AAU9DHY7_9LACO|nr:16S rRNA (adenine(1518)-N(6)/adenine(1519)-N(6))-dimethyltransferase RsmA [Xylocopilactobacillus apis]BDR56352.1 ribosomal RNA small subunit methyltransferase A [Xylocopilactobacillus apis]